MRATPHPGHLTLPTTKLQALHTVAASGSQAAPTACRLLQFYEPGCHCVLPAAQAAPTARPALAATLATALTMPLLSEAHPNPAGQTATFTYALPDAPSGGPARLLVRDLLGRVVATQPLADTQGEVRLPVGAWAGGLYVSSLEVNGRVLATRKLVVVH